MGYKHKNFAYSTLGSQCLNNDTSFTVSSAEGTRFPSTGNFKIVIYDSSASDPATATNIEILTATLNSGDVFNIIGRAEEGTTAKTWDAGSKIVHTATAAVFDNIAYRPYAQLYAANQTFAASAWTAITFSNSTIYQGITYSGNNITFAQVGVYLVTVTSKWPSTDVWTAIRMYDSTLASTVGKSSGFGTAATVVGSNPSVSFLVNITNTTSNYQIQVGRGASTASGADPGTLNSESIYFLSATITRVD